MRVVSYGNRICLFDVKRILSDSHSGRVGDRTSKWKKRQNYSETRSDIQYVFGKFIKYRFIITYHEIYSTLFKIQSYNLLRGPISVLNEIPGTEVLTKYFIHHGCVKT